MQNKKYILFTCSLWEGLNQRIETFFKMISIFQKLSSNTYILVLPKLDSQHFSGNILWKNYYDYSKFPFGIIEHDKYIGIFQNRIETILDFSLSDNALAEICYYMNTDSILFSNYITVHSDPAPQQMHSYFSKIHPLINNHIQKNNLLWKKKPKFINNMDQLISLIMSSGNNILLSYAENLQIKINYQNPEFRKILLNLEFKKELQNLADEFIKEKFTKGWDPAFGAQPLVNFSAIHIRLGDYKEIYNIKFNNVIKKIKDTIRHKNFSNIFISTNANNKEKKKIYKKLINKNRTIFFYENNKLEKGQLAIIDQIICIKANNFIGNQKSLFSKFISCRRNDHTLYYDTKLNKNKVNHFH